MNTKKLAVVSILSALMIVFTSISNYIQIGSISINLALIVIVVAAIKYGKDVALFVGIVNGIMIMLAPSTALFFSLSIAGTIITCLSKAGLAGYLSGLLYEKIKDKTKIAILLSAAIVPIINTGVFFICSVIFYNSAFGNLITMFVTVNFAIELIVTIVISMAISYILK